MSQHSNELRDKRRRLVEEARGINNKALEEKRDLTQEEENRYNAAMKEVGELKDQIDAMETRENELAELDSQMNALERRATAPAAGDGTAVVDPAQEEQRLVQLYTGIEQRAAQIEAEMRAFNDYLRTGHVPQEMRTLQAGVDTLGGYLVTPQMFMAELIKELDSKVFVRTAARTFQVTSAESLGAPSLDTDLTDAEWTTELQTSAAEDLGFGKRELRPHPLTKAVKVSHKLLRVAALDPEALVRERLAYKFGTAMENGYLNGHGAGRPLGVFIASADGINTDRDVPTGAATSIKADSLRDMKYKVKAEYFRRSRWCFHRDALAAISKLKSVDAQYLWSPGLRANDEDTILGRPIDESDFAPNTFTDQLYIGLLGDWQAGYWIADALTLQVQRLVELYAATNEIGYIGRAESDGMPVLSEAFARLKMGTS